MKKLTYLLIGLALVLAVGCKKDADTPAEPEETAGKTIVQEMLSNLPISFKEFEAQIKASGNRSVSRTAVALTDSETQGFSTSGYDYGDDSDLYTKVFLTVLKNDISTLSGFENNKDFTIPDSFNVSQSTLTQLGLTADDLACFTWGSVKFEYEKPNVSIYWKIHMVNGDGDTSNVLILIKGQYDIDTDTYTDLTRYTSYNFGYPMIGAAHFFTSNGIIGVNVVTNEEDRISKSLFMENNTESESYADGWDYQRKAERYSYTNSTYQVNYSADNDTYNVFDNNKNLIVTIAGTTDSPKQYVHTIPFHFIDVEQGSTVTRTEGELSTQTTYYIGNDIVSNIHSIEFENNKWYTCYVISSNTAGTFSFSEPELSFAETQTVTQGIQKINSMVTNFKSGALNSYLGTEAELQALDTQCKAWADSL